MPQQCSKTTRRVLAHPNVAQLRINGRGQTERVIKLSTGKHTSVTCDEIRASISRQSGTSSVPCVLHPLRIPTKNGEPGLNGPNALDAIKTRLARHQLLQKSGCDSSFMLRPLPFCVLLVHARTTIIMIVLRCVQGGSWCTRPMGTSGSAPPAGNTTTGGGGSMSRATPSTTP